MTNHIEDDNKTEHSFLNYNLPQELINAINKLNFTSPTKIQHEVIPIALEGQDILGSAQTGTGKTAAFAIPLIAFLCHNPSAGAMVITPTRELAVQVLKTIQSLIGEKHKEIKTAMLIGGEPMGKQLDQLKRDPKVIVGTPGRIFDHMSRKTLSTKKIRYLVLDETDRMLDMGFTPQINQIVENLPEKRQTLLFSATLPKNIVAAAQKYLIDPVRISVGSTNKPIDKVSQEILFVKEDEKFDLLLKQLEEKEGTAIVFTKTKYAADELAYRLKESGYSADALHGDLSHNKRERVTMNFRKCKYRVLVATDIASRGLDISHVMNVINYDLPQCPEDYIHRIGRTGRAGAEGRSICFITHQDGKKWKAIQNLIDPNAAKNSGGHSNGPRKSFGSNGGSKSGFKPRKSFDSERRFDDNGNNGGRRFESKRFDDNENGGRRFESKRFDGKKLDHSFKKKASY
jgi:ATP-dependent RNA helicase DeaD